MGVDIYLTSGKKNFSCRLYWITHLIDEYSWRFKGTTPELIIEKKLGKEEIQQLLVFLKFCITALISDKKRAIEKLDSEYFKKTQEIHESLKQLIDLIKQNGSIDKELFPKLRGLLRRLEGFTEIYGQDPQEQKKEIHEDFDEKISLVKSVVPFLQAILTKGGTVRIG